MHFAFLIPFPKDIVQIEELKNSYMPLCGNKRDKVKRKTLISEMEGGGLKKPDLD